MKRTILFILVLTLLAGSQLWAQPGAADAAEVAAAFRQYVEQMPFLADSSVEAMRMQVDEHSKCLQNWKDKEAYMEEHGVAAWLSRQRDSVGYYRGLAPGLCDGFMQQYSQRGINDEAACRDSLRSIVGEKLASMEASLNRLQRVVESEGLIGRRPGAGAWFWLALVALVGGVAAWLMGRRSRGAGRAEPAAPTAAPAVQPAARTIGGGEAGIVVRRKTTTILKKQSLEDVIGNPAYLQVDAEDFTYESAVRRIYIKDSCIRDIYNMYAADLQRPDSPKEDGCMVLGRWVYDQESQEYYVSLEQTVMPGDDAVFAEYELNFGGKIKLKVVEQLRKLRRETGFQYDLTCWVHSHPGLGVFFSNSDVGVQMQLKHPAHPHFLTAIVVDILTPDMELGIFTFRRDHAINSLSDLKRKYSLREWNEWARQSGGQGGENDGRDGAEADEYDVMAASARNADNCAAVGLSAGAIVDVCMSTSGDSHGLLGLIHGHSSRRGDKMMHHAQRLSNNEQVDGMALLGCLVADVHGSIPSIRKAVAHYLDKIHFVLAYAPGKGTVTAIPVVDGELSTDEHLYGEQTLDELKAWTRKIEKFNSSQGDRS